MLNLTPKMNYPLKETIDYFDWLDSLPYGSEVTQTRLGSIAELKGYRVGVWMVDYQVGVAEQIPLTNWQKLKLKIKSVLEYTFGSKQAID